MRVGIVAIQHESNTFLSESTTLNDFRRDALLVHDAVRREYKDSHHEVGGFFAGLAEEHLEAVPLLLALAVPGGTITAETQLELLDMMLASFDGAGRLDGLLLAPHGAAVSEIEPDFDGHWLTRARECVGPECPIVCTLDPHANVSRRMIEACDATIAYRTNPHLDQRETGRRAARLIARTFRGEVCPKQALATPPIAISIDRQATAKMPCRGLYELADEQQMRQDVLANSVVLGFPYADVAELGSSFIAVTDGDRPLAESCAEEMADYLIEHRHAFACELTGVAEAMWAVRDTKERVCLLDMGDNVGGGAPGDGTVLARALLEYRIDAGFACLCDAVSVGEIISAGIGSRLALSVGGTSDPQHGEPLELEVAVRGIYSGRFYDEQPRHGGRVSYNMGPTAVVVADQGLTLMLTTQRVPPFSLRQLASCELDPTGFRVLIAKGVNAPIAAYREVCQRMIRVNTPGVTCADMRDLVFKRRRRPLFPFEEVAAAK